MDQACRLATLASSAKVMKKSVTAVQMLPTMMPITSSAAMLFTRRAKSSTKAVTSMEPAKAAAMTAQKGTPETYRSTNTMVMPTSIFAPEEMPST